MANTDPVHGLQSFARKFGKHVAPSRAVSKVTISDHVGEIASLHVSATDEPMIEEEAKAKPGWDFTGLRPRFDGTLVDISGRKLALLRLLVEADRPLSVDELRPAWEGSQVEENSIRWQIMELRKALKSQFPGLDEPIATTTDGYKLTIRC